jgi:DNA-binding HxlR family transcriptional regulator
MRKVSFADMNCSIAETLELVGEWWTLLIVRDVFLGVRRFDDFVERLGISRNVLTDRLDKLVAAEILERRPYDAGRGRYDYLLTERGRALWPVLTALRQWGDEWLLGEGNDRSCSATSGAGTSPTSRQRAASAASDSMQGRYEPNPAPLHLDVHVHPAIHGGGERTWCRSRPWAPQSQRWPNNSVTPLRHTGINPTSPISNLDRSETR